MAMFMSRMSRMMFSHDEPYVFGRLVVGVATGSAYAGHNNCDASNTTKYVLLGAYVGFTTPVVLPLAIAILVPYIALSREEQPPKK